MPPLMIAVHGEMTLAEARIGQGSLLVLEPGPAPTSNEVQY